MGAQFHSQLGLKLRPELPWAARRHLERALALDLAHASAGTSYYHLGKLNLTSLSGLLGSTLPPVQPGSFSKQGGYTLRQVQSCVRTASPMQNGDFMNKRLRRACGGTRRNALDILLRKQTQTPDRGLLSPSGQCLSDVCRCLKKGFQRYVPSCCAQ